jgi:hypothetical protein
LSAERLGAVVDHVQFRSEVEIVHQSGVFPESSVMGLDGGFLSIGHVLFGLISDE